MKDTKNLGFETKAIHGHQFKDRSVTVNTKVSIALPPLPSLTVKVVVVVPD